MSLSKAITTCHNRINLKYIFAEKSLYYIKELLIYTDFAAPYNHFFKIKLKTKQRVMYTTIVEKVKVTSQLSNRLTLQIPSCLFIIKTGSPTSRQPTQRIILLIFCNIFKCIYKWLVPTFRKATIATRKSAIFFLILICRKPYAVHIALRQILFCSIKGNKKELFCDKNGAVIGKGTIVGEKYFFRRTAVTLFIGVLWCFASYRISWAFDLHSRWCCVSLFPCKGRGDVRKLQHPKLKNKRLWLTLFNLKELKRAMLNRTVTGQVRHLWFNHNFHFPWSYF